MDNIHEELTLIRKALERIADHVDPPKTEPTESVYEKQGVMTV